MSDALRQVAATFGVEWDDAELRRGLGTLDGAVGGLRRLGELVAGSAIVAGIHNFAHEFEAAAGQVEDTAATLGTSAQELQELRYAAEQGGLGAEQMTAALAALERASGGAGKAASSAFAELGVRTRDAAGQTRPLTDLVDDVASAFDRVEDPARRAVLAQQLFGGAGRRMLTLLHDGEGGLRAWRDEFEALGGGISDDAIAAAGAYGDEVNRVNVAMTSLRSAVAVVLLPALTWVTQHLTRGIAWFSRLARETHVVQVTLAALGAVGVAVAARMLAAWLPVLAPFLKIALLVLLVDDLITLFQGGDSVIGRFLDRLGGVGTSRRFVDALREAWEGMQLAGHDAGNALSLVFAQLGRDLASVWAWVVGVGQVINQTFATASQWIENTFGISLDRIIARYRQLWSLIQPLALLMRAGNGIGERIAGGLGLRGAANGAGQDLARNAQFGIDFWRGIFNAPPPPATATAPGAARGGTTVQQTNTTTIEVHGATDPAATANEVERRQREAQARQLRAARAALTREGSGG